MGPDGTPAEHFTDEELAFLRYARFSELPTPVPPADWVETVEPTPVHEEPPPPTVRHEWG